MPGQRVETLLRTLAAHFVGFGGLLLAVFDRRRTIVTKSDRKTGALLVWNPTFAEVTARLGVGITTFAEAARRVVEKKRAGWCSAAYAMNWFRTPELHVFQRTGKVPVSEVKGTDMLEILAAIWHR